MIVTHIVAYVGRATTMETVKLQSSSTWLSFYLSSFCSFCKCILWYFYFDVPVVSYGWVPYIHLMMTAKMGPSHLRAVVDQAVETARHVCSHVPTP